jgi:predicted dehydrogenase
VHAAADFGDESGVDERVTATLYFPEGGIVQFDTGFHLAAGTYYQCYEIFGERGRIRVPEGFTQVQAYRGGDVADVSFFVSDGDGTERVNVSASHSWQLEAEYFADCVLKSEKISFPAENGILNMKVIDAVYASARDGGGVTV